MYSFLKCIATAGLLTSFLFLAACGSQQQKPESEDIYSSLREDNVQYQGSGTQGGVLDPAVLQEKVTEIRNLYFRKKLSEAQMQAERLLRLSNPPEAYYWLARINLDQANYQQAYDIASKGLSITDNDNLRKALERLQNEAQLGNL